ncbi:replication endonuclease [Salmonella enterica subsp. houtenae]|uniref:Replication endonuclease n=1 Tax=Salmonella houtenae TaxID=59205 RepID=A0A5Y2SCR8_SALHO|nr:replication endonuclease [Salmonella enterica subsp. houtenae]QKT20119.1 replication endonuclease [Salmonella enterica]HAU3223592.1 replication endonuclease [Salmonella enterica subsp. houtenae]
MINPNKPLSQKALAGASFLRMHAKAMAGDDDFFVAIMSEPHTIAANAIEQLVKENAELRAQLIAFQKAANGTPHWHMVLWFKPEDLEKATTVFREYALEEDGDEPGAEDYRFEAVQEDKSRGRAVGYM